MSPTMCERRLYNSTETTLHTRSSSQLQKLMEKATKLYQSQRRRPVVSIIPQSFLREEVE